MNNIDYIKVSLVKIKSNIIVLIIKGESPDIVRRSLFSFICYPRSQVVLGIAHI